MFALDLGATLMPNGTGQQKAVSTSAVRFDNKFEGSGTCLVALSVTQNVLMRFDGADPTSTFHLPLAPGSIYGFHPRTVDACVFIRESADGVVNGFPMKPAV